MLGRSHSVGKGEKAGRASADEDPAEKGKRRTRNKKKTRTTLKKLILMEREERVVRANGGGDIEAYGAGIGKVFPEKPPADLPEFVPFVTPATRVGEMQGSGQEVAAVGAAVGDAGGEASLLGASPPGFGTFVPSWCLGLEPTQPADVADVAVQETGEELPVAKAMERLNQKSRRDGRSKAQGDREPGGAKADGDKPEQANTQKQCNQFEVRRYVHQVLSDDLDEKVKFLLGELVRLQDRAKEKDPNLSTKQRRYCVGMREARRAVVQGKSKGLICAPNLEMCTAEGGLDDSLEGLIDICRENDVPVIFALSRNRIGKALGRNVRQSVVTVLSADGTNQVFKGVVRQTEELRRMWVLQRMSACDGPVPVPPRLPLGALDDLVVSAAEDEDAASVVPTAGETTDDEARPPQAARKARHVAPQNPEEAERRRDEELLERERVAAEARAAIARERAAVRSALMEEKARMLKAEQDEKRLAQKAVRAEVRKKQKAEKEVLRKHQLEAKRLEDLAKAEAEEKAEIARQEAIAEAERIRQERAEAYLRAEEEKRRKVEEELEKQRAIMAERAAKEAARLEAEEQKRLAALEAAAEEEESSDDELPTGFSADLF